MAKGGKTDGRKKGTPNRLTFEIKTAIENAFIAVGGERYLAGVARKHPAVFCALLARLIPKPQEVTMPSEPEEPSIDLDNINYDVARRLAWYLDRASHLTESDPVDS